MARLRRARCRSWICLMAVATVVWNMLRLFMDTANLIRTMPVLPNLDTPELNLQSSPPELHLLTTVPFYVYEDLAWENATLGNIPVEELANSPTSSFRKHMDDYWLMKASLRHPKRTRDPTQAEIFFIPTLLNVYAYRANPQLAKSHDLCWNHKCNLDLMKQVQSHLQKSPYFQAHPERHMVVASHFFARPDQTFWKNNSFLPVQLREQLYLTNMVQFETSQLNHPDRLRLGKLYVGNPCPVATKKTEEVALIATMTPVAMRPSFEDRHFLCNSLRWSTYLQGLNESERIRIFPEQPKPPRVTLAVRYAQCGGQATHWNDQGALPQCPALSEARFGFHPRGDTWGSNRLLDILLSGTIPIFTRKEQYQVVPSWIDWDTVSYCLDLEEIFVRFSSNTTASRTARRHALLLKLYNILDDQSGYQKRVANLQRHRDLFDHETLYPLDMYLYQMQSRYLPHTRHDPLPPWWQSILVE